jgi:hypothetical protein
MQIISSGRSMAKIIICGLLLGLLMGVVISHSDGLTRVEESQAGCVAQPPDTSTRGGEIQWRCT